MFYYIFQSRWPPSPSAPFFPGVEVRCCGVNEVEAEGEGWRSGSCVPEPAAYFREPCLTPRSFRRVPLAVAGQLGREGMMLGWTAASAEAAEEEEEFDLT